MASNEYNTYTIYLCNNGFRFAKPVEKYTENGLEERFAILGNIEKGLLVTAESRNGKVLSSRMFFEISTIVDGEPIKGDRADAFIDMLVYESLPCVNESGQEVARVFNYNVKAYGIDTILEKLSDPYLELNTPWKHLDMKNINLLKRSENKYNLEKINLSKISKFSEKMKNMVGYKQQVPKNPELFS